MVSRLLATTRGSIAAVGAFRASPRWEVPRQRCTVVRAGPKRSKVARNVCGLRCRAATPAARGVFAGVPRRFLGRTTAAPHGEAHDAAKLRAPPAGWGRLRCLPAYMIADQKSGLAGRVCATRRSGQRPRRPSAAGRRVATEAGSRGASTTLRSARRAARAPSAFSHRGSRTAGAWDGRRPSRRPAPWRSPVEVVRRDRSGRPAPWRVWSVTANDDLDASRLYQRRGTIVGVVPGAVDEPRALRPSIPSLREYGITLHDEPTLELPLRSGPGSFVDRDVGDAVWCRTGPGVASSEGPVRPSGTAAVAVGNSACPAGPSAQLARRHAGQPRIGTDMSRPYWRQEAHRRPGRPIRWTRGL